jgi:uncharacterized protein (DUF362 family)
MDRREFLRASGVLLAAGLPRLRRAGAEPFPLSNDATVYEVENFTTEKAAQLFDAFGGISGLTSRPLNQATVLIKPNLCLSAPEDAGVATPLHTVELLCKALIDGGVTRIIIADHTLGQTSDFQSSPWLELPNKLPEIKVIFANEERLYAPKPVEGKVLKTVDVLRLLERADIMLNVATAKHHSGTHVSLGVKNLMGCIWNRATFHTTMDLHQAIGDLPLAIKPTLNIVDATRVLLTGGPVGPGRVLRENRVFAGADIVAVDSVVVSRYSFGGKNLSAREIPHLHAASHNDVGVSDLDKITIVRI